MRLNLPVKLVTLLLLISALVACGNDGPKEPLPRQVKIYVVGQGLVNSGLSQDAGKEVKNPELLSFDASGKVMEVLTHSGASVSAGQALGRLMPSSMSMTESSALTSYRAARAEIQSAEADFKRYTDLRQKKFISASDFDKRIATVELARAKFEQTMEQLGFVTLRALEAGVVKKIDFQMGQQVSAQQPVVKIKLTTPVKNQLNQAKGSAELKIGSFEIPSESIHGDGASVYRVKLDEGSQEIGTLEVIKVVVSSVDESRVVAAEGLRVGDKIVSTGWHALTAGQKVRVALTAKAL